MSGRHHRCYRPKGPCDLWCQVHGCTLRDRCTTSRRGLKTIIHPHDDEFVAARRQWKEADRARGVPPLAPHGRAFHRVAGQPWKPAGPIPRRREEPAWPLSASPPSTSGGWSTSDSKTKEDGGSDRLTRCAQARVVKEGPHLGHCPPRVADFNPFHVGASVGHVLSLRAPTYAWDPVSSTAS